MCPLGSTLGGDCAPLPESRNRRLGGPQDRFIRVIVVVVARGALQIFSVRSDELPAADDTEAVVLGEGHATGGVPVEVMRRARVVRGDQWQEERRAQRSLWNTRKEERTDEAVFRLEIIKSKGSLINRTKFRDETNLGKVQHIEVLPVVDSLVVFVDDTFDARAGEHEEGEWVVVVAADPPRRFFAREQ